MISGSGPWQAADEARDDDGDPFLTEDEHADAETSSYRKKVRERMQRLAEIVRGPTHLREPASSSHQSLLPGAQTTPVFIDLLPSKSGSPFDRWMAAHFALWASKEERRSKPPRLSIQMLRITKVKQYSAALSVRSIQAESRQVLEHVFTFPSEELAKEAAEALTEYINLARAATGRRPSRPKVEVADNSPRLRKGCERIF